VRKGDKGEKRGGGKKSASIKRKKESFFVTKEGKLRKKVHGRGGQSAETTGGGVTCAGGRGFGKGVG